MITVQAEQVQTPVHSITRDGRVMHLFVKVNGVWTCGCGERRDRFGNVL